MNLHTVHDRAVNNSLISLMYIRMCYRYITVKLNIANRKDDRTRFCTATHRFPRRKAPPSLFQNSFCSAKTHLENERVARRENGLSVSDYPLSLRQNKNSSFPGHAPGKDTLRAANAATKTRFTGRKQNKRKRILLSSRHLSISLLSSSPQTRRIPARFRFRR